MSIKEVYKLYCRYRGDVENCPIVLLYGTCLPGALVVLAVHTISYICDNMSIVSDTYMSFTGVRLIIKGRILFYWVVVHTL